MSGLAKIDGDLVEFLKSLDLSSTFVYFLSDHGIHYGQHKATIIGDLEHRLPAFFMIAPIKYLESSVQGVLRQNQQALITHFDVYATISSTPYFLNRRNISTNIDLPKQSKSLFTKVREQRSCSEAGIPPEYCACTKWEATKISDMEGSIFLHKIVYVCKETTVFPNNSKQRMRRRPPPQSAPWTSSRMGDGKARGADGFSHAKPATWQ
mmetsp:Transcript_2359/g.8243  ORF Transcript_2359/g.8243 Transcript_2359/m.8243 type:complete len:209 (-) Transcript_2359:219-845(-)